jgi:hypothetical protein
VTESWAPGAEAGGAPAISRHRRPGSKAPTKLGAGALILAALAVGGVITSGTPDTDRRQRPFVRAGAMGQAVNARSFDVTVLGVRGAAKVAEDGLEHDTSGVWVLVRVRLVARDEPVLVGYAAVRDAGGHTYLASNRLDLKLVMGGHDLQPGVPVTGEIAFEVPRDAAPSLSLRLASPLLDQRMDAVAEIPLGIDNTMVDKWLAQTEAATVTKPGAES